MGLLGAMLSAGCGVTTPWAATASDSAFSAQGTKGSRKGAVDWTVFVYMGGDNNLSDAAQADLNEMEAGLTSDRVRFVALVDQEGVGDSRILEIRHDPNGMNDTLVSPVVDDRGAVIPANHEVDTGSAQTMENFVKWSAKQYPSRNSMFVIWNHGGGAFTNPEHLKSFCWDDHSGNSLNLVDFWRTAQRISSKMKFDITGFDTCLLGHTETAYQLRDLSKFLVSSEKTEPGDGWDYKALAETLSRSPQMYPRELSSEIVKGYQAYYKNDRSTTTLSAIDLEKLKDRLVPNIDTLSSRLKDSLATPGTRDALKQVFAQALDLTATDEGEEDAVDLGLVTKMLVASPAVPGSIKEAAQGVSYELQRATVANLTTRTEPGVYNGLKIYMTLEGYNPAYGNGAHQIFGTTGWAKFLQAFNQRV